MTVRLSASRLGIFKHCGWFARDDVDYANAEIKSRKEFGTDFHQAVEAYLADGTEPADEEVMLHLQAFAEELARVPDTVIVDCEPAWAWNTESREARKLGNNIGREYEAHGLTAAEIPGSMDLVLIRGGVLVVVDLKTGYGEVDDPAENEQLNFGSLCYSKIARSHGLEQRQEIWYVRPGKVWVEGSDIDFLDLGQFESQLASRWKLRPYLPATPGEHCAWCPAAGGCPATSQVVGALVDTSGETFSTTVRSNDHAAWMIERLSIIEKAAEAVRHACQQWSDQNGGVRLKDGKIWKQIEGNRTGLNQAAVKAFLGPRLAEFQTTHPYTQYRAVNPEGAAKKKRRKK